MRELRFTQQNPQYGLMVIVMRILGKIIFMKFDKTSPQKEQMMNQLREKGAEITKSENWIKINLFKKSPYAKLGETEFNTEEKTDDEMEEILANFFIEKYKQAKFRVEEL